MVNEPIYHIWMQNWNSFFFLNHRLSSVLPCDFVLKYDDDQWPIDNALQKRLIDIAKGKNIIIGNGGHSIKNKYCGYSPKYFKKIKNGIVDHSSVPILVRRGYFKLDARNKIYSLYGGEDVSLSLNSWKICKVTSKVVKMNLMQRQKDGNTHIKDRQIISAYNKAKETPRNLFRKIYCYLIRSGYIPRLWAEFYLPQKDRINISIKHKRLN
jgi:hypothetical protein